MFFNFLKIINCYKVGYIKISLTITGSILSLLKKMINK
jgi:hypothetical protein